MPSEWSGALARTHGGALSMRQGKVLRVDFDFDEPFHPYGYYHENPDGSGDWMYEIGYSSQMLVSKPYFRQSSGRFHYGTDYDYTPALRIPLTGVGTRYSSGVYRCAEFASSAPDSHSMFFTIGAPSFTPWRELNDDTGDIEWHAEVTIAWYHVTNGGGSDSVSARISLSFPDPPRLRFGHKGTFVATAAVDRVTGVGDASFHSVIKSLIESNLHFTFTAQPS